ncbi:protein SecF [Salmonella enterica subsp. enterica serovar Minnesota str. A4-603]|nr:protein SecF [Salmonella enterica subsp. enterica serovar Minnesota str. A4-603]
MAASASLSCQSEECDVAQEYTVEQLNHGRKVYDSMTLCAGTSGSL